MLTRLFQTLAKFREIAVLGAALWLMQMASPVVVVVLAMLLFLLGIFTLVTGWGVPRFKGRWKGLGILFLSSFFFITAVTVHNEQQEERWAQMRANDPDAYLAEIARVNDDRWLRELGELRPDAYQAEMVRREREAEETAVRHAAEVEAETARREQRERDAAERRAEAEARRAAEAEAARLRACEGNEAAAYVLIQTDVRNGLRAPSTARFPAGSGGRTQYLGDCIYAVQGHFDAQNGFGVMIRGTFSGTILYFPENRRGLTLTLDIRG